MKRLISCASVLIILIVGVFLSCTSSGVGNVVETNPIVPLTPAQPKPTESTHTIEFEVKTGERVTDFAARMEKKEIFSVAVFEEFVNNYDFSDNYGFVPEEIPGLRKLEGLFVPGRYSFTYIGLKQDEYEDVKWIVTSLLESAKMRFNSMQTVEFLTPYEQLILASVVEKEAAFNIQYEEVASTLWNRLRAYYETGGFWARFGCCSTVEYVLGYHRPFLIHDDLVAVKDSPYNTYFHAGLMPTPIAFVSNEALAAVANPIKTDYWFFVMDWLEGRLYFNKYLEGHSEDVTRIVAKIRAEYGDLLHKRMDGYYYDYFSTTGKVVE